MSSPINCVTHRWHLVNRAVKLTSPLLRGYATQTKLDVSDESASKGPVQEVKPFSAMPGRKGWPIIEILPEASKITDKLHIFQERGREDYGRVWCFKLGGENAVFVNHTDGVKDVIRHEGKNPYRPPVPMWMDAYKTLGKPLGLLQSHGETWQRMRKTVDKPIMRPSSISEHITNLHDVAKCCLKRLTEMQNTAGEIRDIDKLLFNWALESSCKVLYDRRLGCLEPNPPESSAAFVNAIQEVLRLTGELAFYPPFWGKLIRRKDWKSVAENFGIMFENAREEIDRCLNSKDSQSAGSFISYILSRDSLSTEEIMSAVTELMSASVDSTSNTVHALLWEVARRPDVQRKMYEEICTVLPPGTEVTYQKLEKLTYIKAVIKEVTRLYRAVLASGRMMEEDAVVCGYEVPKGTQVFIAAYGIGRNPELFDNPAELNPERWIRSLNKNLPEPHSYVLFGMGQRSCIGRRIAMSEMQLLCIELLRRFQLSTTTPELKLATRLVLVVAEPIQLTLTPRA